MRLWSLHCKYLDQKGLGGLWQEALLAQSCLLNGKYIECNKCYGDGYFKDYNWTTGENEKPMETYIMPCGKCKGAGKRKTPYYNHPQLERFKEAEYPLRAIGSYLTEIWREAKERGYNYNAQLIEHFYRFQIQRIKVTKGQIDYEVKHLQKKLLCRDLEKCIQLTKDRQNNKIEINQLFQVIDWEKV